LQSCWNLKYVNIYGRSHLGPTAMHMEAYCIRMDHFALGHEWITSGRCLLPIVFLSLPPYSRCLLPHSAIGALLLHSTIGLLLRHQPSSTPMISNVMDMMSAIANSSYSVTLEALSQIDYPKCHIKVIKCKSKNYVVFHKCPNNFRVIWIPFSRSILSPFSGFNLVPC
jgi:hypothetical protein